MVIERKARRQFDANFKLEVARRVKDQGLSVADVCRSMDLGEGAGCSSMRQSWAEKRELTSRLLPSSSASASWKRRIGSYGWITTF
jgi:transposase-like protein